MSFPRFASVLASFMLVACAGTPETNSWLNGVSLQEATEIRAAIRSHTSAHVHPYLRREDSSIDVSMDGDGIYNARKVRGKWHFVHEIVVT